ncbi:MAG TPA: NADPH-dependent FMN reductase [Candidatus Limnocylindrales bacterium]|nr:NADPH-dependent FMN reductase [Candidatus Limnocylindrales bacterium]
MSEDITVLGIGGSMRPGSHTDLLLKLALREARTQGMRIKLFDLKSHPLPILDPQALGDPPAPAQLLLREVRAARALILATPVYHGTISGAFKNAVDYLQALEHDDPPWLTGKVVGLLALGTTGGMALQAITAMEHISRALRALTVPTAVAAEEGNLAALPPRLARMCAEIHRYATLPTVVAPA